MYFDIMTEFQFVTDIQIYERVILDKVPKTRNFLWIATSDIKDLHAHKGRSMVPFLEFLSDLIQKGVGIRLIHAREAGERFRNDFDKYPNLITGLERLVCPRTHFKCVVVDGLFAYSGSANLTGAGMGAKSPRRRNFESGVISHSPSFIKDVMAQFDAVWMGRHCKECGRKEYCTGYMEMGP